MAQNDWHKFWDSSILMRPVLSTQLLWVHCVPFTLPIPQYQPPPCFAAHPASFASPGVSFWKMHRKRWSFVHSRNSRHHLCRAMTQNQRIPLLICCKDQVLGSPITNPRSFSEKSWWKFPGTTMGPPVTVELRFRNSALTTYCFPKYMFPTRSKYLKHNRFLSKSDQWAAKVWGYLDISRLLILSLQVGAPARHTFWKIVPAA